MKRTSAPSEIKINKVVFILTVGKENKEIIKEAKAKGLRYRTVKVMNSKLKGVRDLHDKFYKPSIFIYVEKRKRETLHFICVVKDSLYKYPEIRRVASDAATPIQAEKYFRNHEDIKPFIGKKRYQITFRQNAISIQ